MRVHPDRSCLPRYPWVPAASASCWVRYPPNRWPEACSGCLRAGAGSGKNTAKKCDTPQIPTGLHEYQNISLSWFFAVEDRGSEAISDSVGSTHVLQTFTLKCLLHVAQTRWIERKALGENCKNRGHIRILTKRMARSECADLHRNILHRTYHPCILMSYYSIYT